MPPSPELHIRIGPDDQRTRDLLEQAGIPIYKEIPLPGEGNLETSLPWEEELARLEQWIVISRVGVISQDPEIIAGYGNLFKELNEHGGLQSFGYTSEDITHFALDILSVFEKFLEAHHKLGERPALQNHRGATNFIQYERLEDFMGVLTPRQVRVAIFNWGLAGETKNRDELQEMEGISGVRKLIHRLRYNLSHCLRRNQIEKTT